MDFVDAALIKIADPATRAAVFDEPTLADMAAAAYDASSLKFQGPYAAIFDKFQLGLPVSSFGSCEGVFRPMGGAPSSEVQLQISGLGPLLPMRADALWTGSIVARSTPMNSRIESVRMRFSLADIDSAIRADLGALPGDAAALESERRKRFVTLIKSAMAQPSLLTDAVLDEWLEEIGASSVGDLLTNHRNVVAPGVLQIGYSAPDAGAPGPVALPIAAAILIRDKTVSIAQLLMESKMLREQLMDRGIVVPTKSSLPARNPVLTIWLVPTTLFDDAGWPGAGADADALRADRRRKAAAWLAPEGIVIAGVAP